MPPTITITNLFCTVAPHREFPGGPTGPGLRTDGGKQTEADAPLDALPPPCLFEAIGTEDGSLEAARGSDDDFRVELREAVFSCVTYVEMHRGSGYPEWD